MKTLEDVHRKLAEMYAASTSPEHSSLAKITLDVGYKTGIAEAMAVVVKAIMNQERGSG